MHIIFSHEEEEEIVHTGVCVPFLKLDCGYMIGYMIGGG